MIVSVDSRDMGYTSSEDGGSRRYIKLRKAAHGPCNDHCSYSKVDQYFKLSCHVMSCHVMSCHGSILLPISSK